MIPVDQVPDDEAMLTLLADALRDVRPLTDRVAHFGRGVFAWRGIDQDLLRASLTFDSLLEPAVADRSGGEGDPRVLVFTAAPLSVELEVQEGYVLGRIVPPGPGRVVAEDTDGETAAVEADELGFFTLHDLPGGPIRLRCDTPTGKLVTDWVRL